MDEVHRDVGSAAAKRQVRSYQRSSASVNGYPLHLPRGPLGAFEAVGQRLRCGRRRRTVVETH